MSEFTIHKELEKENDNGAIKGTFYRYSVKKDNKPKAMFWFTKAFDGSIYSVSSRFIDEHYKWIELFVEDDYDIKNEKHYPTGVVYMQTSSLRMSPDQCRDVIRYFEEASKICELISDFFMNKFC